MTSSSLLSAATFRERSGQRGRRKDRQTLDTAEWHLQPFLHFFAEKRGWKQEGHKVLVPKSLEIHLLSTFPANLPTSESQCSAQDRRALGAKTSGHVRGGGSGAGDRSPIVAGIIELASSLCSEGHEGTGPDTWSWQRDSGPLTCSRGNTESLRGKRRWHIGRGTDSGEKQSRAKAFIHPAGPLAVPRHWTRYEKAATTQSKLQQYPGRACERAQRAPGSRGAQGTTEAPQHQSMCAPYRQHLSKFAWPV